MKYIKILRDATFRMTQGKKTEGGEEDEEEKQKEKPISNIVEEDEDDLHSLRLGGRIA